MPSVHKKSIQEKLLESGNIDSDQALYIVRDFFDIITCSLEKGNEVNIYGFGNFRLLHKKPRPGRDISRNAQVVINERTVVSFTPSSALIHKICENKDLDSIFSEKKNS